LAALVQSTLHGRPARTGFFDAARRRQRMGGSRRAGRWMQRGSHRASLVWACESIPRHSAGHVQPVKCGGAALQERADGARTAAWPGGGLPAGWAVPGPQTRGLGQGGLASLQRLHQALVRVTRHVWCSEPPAHAARCLAWPGDSLPVTQQPHTRHSTVTRCPLSGQDAITASCGRQGLSAAHTRLRARVWWGACAADGRAGALPVPLSQSAPSRAGRL